MRLREADGAAPHAVLALVAGRFVSLPPGRLRHVADFWLHYEHYDNTTLRQRNVHIWSCPPWGACPRCSPLTSHDVYRVLLSRKSL